jgi:hypothetical protein
MSDIKQKATAFYEYTKANVITITNGQGRWKFVLYVWGVLPAVLILLAFQKDLRVYNGFPSFIAELLIAIYFSWHGYVIRKTLKVHPEFVMKVPTKEERIASAKTPEEAEKIKKEIKKETFQKIILMKSWSRTPDYNIIFLTDIFMAWTEIQLILSYLFGGYYNG